MDLPSNVITVITIIVALIISYIITSKDSKNDDKINGSLKDQDTSSDPAIYGSETAEQFYERSKSHIENYLNQNDCSFYTSNSSPRFLVPFEDSDSVFEIVITPYFSGNVKVIDFTAKISSGPIQDSMIPAVAELTNRINAVSINSSIYLDYESREVKVCKSLVVSHFDIDSRMFDWYFRCVLSAGSLRAYLNRVLFNNENPALVALDFAHA